jgi:hypothetical protein
MVVSCESEVIGSSATVAIGKSTGVCVGDRRTTVVVNELLTLLEAKLQNTEACFNEC